MDIRSADENDFEELRSFYIIMNEVITKRHHNYHEENPYFPSDQMMLKAIKGGYQYIGIEDNKIVAAMMADHECDDSYMHAKWLVDAAKDEFLVLHALRVLPEYSGRGYARQLMNCVIEQGKATGQKSLRLDVLEGYEDPLRLYAPLGFQHVDTVEILYEDIGIPKRFCLLEKVL
ncbi:MAG: GNAT family N-acetyltransferase [Lachnospiraceae bacterium]|nr:GNAT family N-acetyltransferase [Candidatus Equihabitans merdae]